jgi:hypothetical protein
MPRRMLTGWVANNRPIGAPATEMTWGCTPSLNTHKEKLPTTESPDREGGKWLHRTVCCARHVQKMTNTITCLDFQLIIIQLY